MTATQRHDTTTHPNPPMMVVDQAQMLHVARAIGNIRQTLEEYLALDNEGSEDSGSLCLECCGTIGMEATAQTPPSAVSRPEMEAAAERAGAVPRGLQVSAPTPAISSSTPEITISCAPTTSSPTPLGLGMQSSSGRGDDVPSASEETWYVVAKGLQIGVFHSWGDVAPLVHDEQHAHYWKAPSKAIAKKQFNEACKIGVVEILYKV